MYVSIKRLQPIVLLLLLFAAMGALLPPQTPPIAVAEEPSASSLVPWRDKGSPFGVVATIGNRVREDEIDTAVALMREAGIQWQREEIFWDRIQQTPGGPFDWDGDGSGFYNYDRAIAAQANAGIQLLGLLDYNPAWFKGKNPHPDEWINDWGNYVYATVARYGRDRGQIKYWELWNEPNLAGSGYESGLYEVKDFVRLLQVGQAAAKAADPEAVIVMGGMASIWGEPPSPFNYDYFTYLELVGQLGGWNYVDIIAIHPYRPDPPEGPIFGRPHGEEDFRTEMENLDELQLRYGPKPVWLTEMGWSAHTLWPGVDEQTQAFFLTRLYIIAMTTPSIEKIFWYDFRNDIYSHDEYEQPIYNEADPELHLGLLRRTYPLDPNLPNLRKPAFLAYRAMTNMLTGAWIEEIIAEDTNPEWPGVYWYRFRSPERRVDVLWRTREANPTMTVQCDCQEALVRAWNGDAKYLLTSTDGTLDLNLVSLGAPIYVEYDPPVAPGGEYFEATGQSLRGGFRDFWYANGGLQRFGYPLTEEIVVPQAGHGRSHVVQYFERARFEHFPGSPSEVVLSRLGDSALLRKGIDWKQLPRRDGAPDSCVFYAEIGHAVCPPFRTLWEQSGGLAGLGYPLTEAFEEVNFETGELYLTQYFERGRLERVPDFAGTPNEIQFGTVGRDYLIRVGGMP